MLSENTIDNLIQPIINRQEAINQYVIRQIAETIKQIGTVSPSDVQQLVRLLKTGSDIRKINEEIARLTGLQVKDVKAIIKEVALDSYTDAKPYYDYRYNSFIPFDKNESLQAVVNAMSVVTEDSFKNLSNTRAVGFLIRDIKNPTKLKWHGIKDTYYSVIDEAAQAVQSGVVDYNTAMRRTVNQLIQSGVRRIDYSPESGRRYTKRLDSAVRQNLLDAVRSVNQAVQNEVGRQINADGKEISVHNMPAPDHAQIQGHQFTNEQWEVLQSQDESKTVKSYSVKMLAVPHRCIGIWNCRHFAFSVILGVMNPNYTQEELDKINSENEKGVIIGGKHYTGYEAVQRQRELETLVRYAKDGQIASIEAGDIQLARRYQAKVDHYTKNYRRFSELANLTPKTGRLYVAGYKKI